MTSIASCGLHHEYLYSLKISSEMNVKGEGDYPEVYDYLWKYIPLCLKLYSL